MHWVVRPGSSMMAKKKSWQTLRRSLSLGMQGHRWDHLKVYYIGENASRTMHTFVNSKDECNLKVDFALAILKQRGRRRRRIPISWLRSTCKITSPSKTFEANPKGKRVTVSPYKPKKKTKEPHTEKVPRKIGSSSWLHHTHLRKSRYTSHTASHTLKVVLTWKH